jgi:hypothetical protein
MAGRPINMLAVSGHWGQVCMCCLDEKLVIVRYADDRG